MPGPVPAQLSRPEAWATESGRRAKVRVPTAVTLQTKPERARALLDQAQAGGVPFACVLTDAGDGAPPPCLTGLEARQVPTSWASSTFGVRLPAEVRAAHAARRARGARQPPSRARAAFSGPGRARCPAGPLAAPGARLRAPSSINNV